MNDCKNYCKQVQEERIDEGDLLRLCRQYLLKDVNKAREIFLSYVETYQPTGKVVGGRNNLTFPFSSVIDILYNNEELLDIYIQTLAKRSKLSAPEQRFLLNKGIRYSRALEGIKAYCGRSETAIDDDILYDLFYKVIHSKTPDSELEEVLASYTQNHELSEEMYAYIIYLQSLKKEKQEKMSKYLSKELYHQAYEKSLFKDLLICCRTYEKACEHDAEFSKQLQKSSMKRCEVPTEKIREFLTSNNEHAMRSLLYKTYLSDPQLKMEIMESPYFREVGMNIPIIVAEIRHSLSIARHRAGYAHYERMMSVEEFLVAYNNKKLQEDSEECQKYYLGKVLPLIRKEGASMEFLAWSLYEYPASTSAVGIALPMSMVNS